MSKRSARKAPHETTPIHVGNGHAKRSRGIALSLNRILVVLFVVVFGGIGSYLLFTSHADTLTSTYAATATKQCIHSRVNGGCYVGDGYATGPKLNVCGNSSDFIAPNPNDGRPDCFKAADASTLSYSCNAGDTLQGTTCTHTKTTATTPVPTTQKAPTCSAISHGQLCTDGTITCQPGYIVRGSQCVVQPKTLTCRAIAHGSTCSDGTTTCSAGYIATTGNTCAAAKGACQNIAYGKNCEGRITCSSGYIVSGSRCIVQPQTVACRTIAYGTTCSNGVTSCHAGYIATSVNTCVRASGACQNIAYGKNCEGKVTCQRGYVVSGSRCVTPKVAATAAAAATARGCVAIQYGKNCNGRITCNSGYQQSGFSCEKAAISTRAKTTTTQSSTSKTSTSSGPKKAVARDSGASRHSSKAECAAGHWYTTGNGGGSTYFGCVDGTWRPTKCPSGQVAAPSTSNSGPCEAAGRATSGVAIATASQTRQAANTCGTIAHAKTCIRHEDGSVVVLTCEPKWEPDGEQCASVVVPCFGLAHAKTCEKVGGAATGTTMIIACYPGYTPNTDNTVCMSSTRGNRDTASPAGGVAAKVTTTKSNICGEPGVSTRFGGCVDPTNHQCGAHGQWKFNGASACGCVGNYTGAACNVPPKTTAPKQYTVRTVSCSSAHVAHGKKCENVGGTIVVTQCVTPGYKVNASQTGCDATAMSTRKTSPAKPKGNQKTSPKQSVSGRSATAAPTNNNNSGYAPCTAYKYTSSGLVNQSQGMCDKDKRGNWYYGGPASQSKPGIACSAGYGNSVKNPGSLSPLTSSMPICVYK